MIEDHVRKRIENDYAYQSEKVKNLFRIIYADPEAAWQLWEGRSAMQGFEAFYKRFQRRPGSLGKMNGRLWFNFIKPHAYQDRLTALEDLHRLSERWREAQMHLHQVDERIQEAQAATEKRKAVLEVEREAKAKVKEIERSKPDQGRSR